MNRRTWLLASITIDTEDCIEPPWRSNGRSPYTIMTVDGRRIGSHVFVCTEVHGTAPAGHQVAHSCGNARCVNQRHLRWATSKDNAADRILHGTSGRGESNPAAKLTVAEVLEVRSAVEAGESKSSVARRYGVSPRLVRFIVQRRKWKHL
jgi:hypothetical protein